MTEVPTVNIQESTKGHHLRLSGSWTLSQLQELQQIDLGRVSATATRENASFFVEDVGITSFDSTGALFLANLLKGKVAELKLKDEFSDLLALIAEKQETYTSKTTFQMRRAERISLSLKDAKDVCDLLGGVVVRVAQGKVRLREMFSQLEETLIASLGVVSLVAALIGVVLAYLFASQMAKYGASIFVVDTVALAMCRELSPLIAAVIMAGRSGSAFTAHLGTMKMNEEIDALRCFGLHPIDLLVTPRVLALMIALPLLVFVCDVAGILGGMFIASTTVGITPHTFVLRLSESLTLKSFLVGIGKAPVFAACIALIGCARGFAVEPNARSIGLNTTATVVQSIVLVILINAAFTVLFVELGI